MANRNRGQRRPKSKPPVSGQDRMRKGNSSKDARRTAEAINTEDRVFNSERNDYSWYSKFPQFTADAGKLAFAKPLGSLVHFPNDDYFTVPGIMRIQFCATPGYTSNLDSPINLSATRFQNYLRAVMKAAGDYDAADTMMYMLAVDSLYMFHSLMRRAYETAQLYSPYNKYYPRNLLQAQGFDPSVADNLAEFRTYINKFAISLSSFPIPANFEITSRHSWMCEGIYLDAEGTRAQSYVFCPTGFWQFNNTVETGSQLDLVIWQDSTNNFTLHNLDQVKAFGNQLIMSIINDQDMTDIAGDILRAYNGQVRKLTEVKDMDMIMPVYNKSVLSQIENATICGNFAPTYTPVISQNPSVNNGAIIFTPTFMGNGDVHNGYYVNPILSNPGQLINMHWESPTPEDVIEATRLMVCLDGIHDPRTDNGYFSPTIFGADIVQRVWIIDKRPITSGAANAIILATNGMLYSTPSTGNATDLTVQQATAMSWVQNFDWCPMLYLTAVNADGTYDMQAMLADVDNLTWISAQQLLDTHTASMFSLFDIPQSSKVGQ